MKNNKHREEIKSDDEKYVRSEEITTTVDFLESSDGLVWLYCIASLVSFWPY